MDDQTFRTVIAIKKTEALLTPEISPGMSSEQKLKVFLPLIEDSFQGYKHLLACKKGCSDCCYQVVQVTSDEVIVILKELRTWPEEALSKLKDRLKTQSDNAYKKQTLAEAALNRVPCAFLSYRGECTIYKVRPLLCQGESSTNAEDCRDPRNQVSRLFGPFVVSRAAQKVMISARVNAFNASTEGLLEFGKAILLGLSTPDIEERYARGENVFKDAAAPIHTYTETCV